MKVVHVSWSDRAGGAARAAARLHGALRVAGVDSSMLVSNAGTPSAFVSTPTALVDRIVSKVAARIDRLPVLRYPKRGQPLFSPAVAPDRVAARLERTPRDIVHLHWCNNGFLRIESVPHLPGPIVWTLHDMWAMTGGCHQTRGCGRYLTGCGACPALGSADGNDLSSRVWARKKAHWKRGDITLVTPSRWLAGLAGQSPLLAGFPIEAIPNCLDVDAFRPSDMMAARRRLGLPLDETVLLFGSKGAEFADLAVRRARALSPKLALHVAFVGMADGQASSPAPGVTYLGFLDESGMAAAYAAADAFVAPSLEDNLPNSIMEALSCGTPCVAFRSGGMGDMIDHRDNGYLANPGDAEDLARGIVWLLGDEEVHRKAQQMARKSVLDRFTPERVAGMYRNLYERVLDRGAVGARR